MILYTCIMGAMLTILPLTSHAYYFSRPSEPTCITLNHDSYCEYKVRRYIREMNEYSNCLAEEAQDEAEKVVKK